MEGVELHVIYYDLPRLQRMGRIFAPIRWARIWGSVLDYYKR